MRTKILFFIAALFTFQLAFSQKQVSGVITDAKDGSPVVGATIKVVGAKTTAISGAEGKFSMKVEDKAQRLLISFVIYKQIQSIKFAK